MQPEDIIQQKEWQQLTAAERELLQPLAATAEEYQLLKSILLNGMDDVEPLPVINSIVQQNLQSALESNLKKKSFAKIYYAAASIVFIVLASWIVFQFKGNEKHGAKLSNLQFKNLDLNFYTSKKTDTDAAHKGNVVAGSKILPSIKTKPKENTLNNNIVREPDFDMAINTYINDDKDLLSLITEVY